MGVEVCVPAVDAPRPPAHVQGGPAWTGGKPSRGQSSPEPALSACLHPINVVLPHVLILVLGTVGGHSAAPSSFQEGM